MELTDDGPARAHAHRRLRPALLVAVLAPLAVAGALLLLGTEWPTSPPSPERRAQTAAPDAGAAPAGTPRAAELPTPAATTSAATLAVAEVLLAARRALGPGRGEVADGVAARWPLDLAVEQVVELDATGGGAALVVVAGTALVAGADGDGWDGPSPVRVAVPVRAGQVAGPAWPLAGPPAPTSAPARAASDQPPPAPADRSAATAALEAAGWQVTTVRAVDRTAAPVVVVALDGTAPDGTEGTWTTWLLRDADRLVAPRPTEGRR